MNSVIAGLAGLFVGGFFGLLVAALLAASKRAEQLEEELFALEESRPTYLLEPREPLDEETIEAIAESFERQVGGRVIILDAFRVDEGDEL